MSGRALAVFAKPPLAGQVKTRLIGDLSPAAAAELAAAFLDDLLERLGRELPPAGVDLRLAWALAPGQGVPSAPCEAFLQEGEDLGLRLLAAAIRMAGEGALPVIVGADLPDLSSELVSQAFVELESGADLVLGPASDGGFYLVGLGAAARRPELFAGVAWGGDEVLSRTVANARSLDLRLVCLAEAADVDRPEDLPPLAARLAASSRHDPTFCPRTRRALARLALPVPTGEES
ncbi:MAG: TIGR04282 family arsenosugar biosynthesis glycosyltransferase [Holophagales bacterium]|nr:MAG: TIGR04282 family arsenosugar biosynthesis glycosyltransferase [Holophagales bacterium]